MTRDSSSGCVARYLVIFLAGTTLLLEYVHPDRVVQASIVVDPDGIGATDIIVDPEGIAESLTNPVSDPLYLISDGYLDFVIGNTAAGSLAIEDGGRIHTGDGFIGRAFRSFGAVVVDGAGSKWNTYPYRNSGDLYVGQAGVGLLTISGGGNVTASGTVYVNPSQTGSRIVFEDGILSAESVIASPADLLGNGVIDTLGIVSDIQVVISQNSDLQQKLLLNSMADQNIIVNLDLTKSGGHLGAGYFGQGSLEISNGMAVTSRNGYIGYAEGSSGTATIQEGSKWILKIDNEYSYLYVGHSGNGSLSIDSGGLVSSSIVLIGHTDEAAGTISVAGAGSELNCKYLSIANGGHGTLTIADGGLVNSMSAFVGDQTGAMGTAIVDGIGSFWRLSGGLRIGNYGTGTLSVSNGGRIQCEGGSLGRESGASGTATIDGTESKWYGGDFDIGHFGTGTLAIAGGGTFITEISYLGKEAGSTGIVTMDGAGSDWGCETVYIGGEGAGTLSIINGGTVTVGDSIVVNPNCTGSTIHLESGIINTDSACFSPQDIQGTGVINTRSIVSDIDLIISQSSPPQPQFVFDSLPGQNVTVNIDFSEHGQERHILGAGYGGRGSLAIRDGVRLHLTKYGILGYRPGSDGQVTIDGSGTQWSIDEELTVGRQGTGKLAISGGAFVLCDHGFVGRQVGSTGTILIDGTSSMLQYNTSIDIGTEGAGELIITNGGIIEGRTGIIGNEPGSSGVVTVDGIGSQWNGYSMIVGNQGTGTLNISNGGTVTADRGIYVNLQHTGSKIVFDNGALLTKELYASPQDLLGTGRLDTQGIVSDFHLMISQPSDLQQHILFNTLPGQNIEVGIDLTSGQENLGIGFDGQGSLVIRDGMEVASANGDIGYLTESVGAVAVEGSGSQWNCSGGLTVARYGTGTLEIVNGAEVSCDSGVVGQFPGSAGTILIDGTGSKLSSGAYFVVGNRGSGSLTIQNGAEGTCHHMAVGAGSTGSVLIRGTGSIGRCFDFIGEEGNGTLTIADGGLAIADSRNDKYIAYKPGSIGTVTIDGTGSKFDYSRYNICLYVGEEGTATLEIHNGGVMEGRYGNIGHKPGAVGAVTVDGTGSQWEIGHNLFVGDEGLGTLTISNGGVVSAGNQVYVNPNRTGSSLLMAGGTLNADSLFVSPENIMGTGTIHTKGLVSDVDLIIDSYQDLRGQFVLNSLPGQDISLTYDIRVPTSGNMALGVGYLGQGSLNIRNSVRVTTRAGYIGYGTGSEGVVTVEGIGSIWEILSFDGPFYVGHKGNGTLIIRDGGTVYSADASIVLGNETGSMGTVLVDGAGSNWNIQGGSNLIRIARGSLTVQNGGNVTVGYGSYTRRLRIGESSNAISDDMATAAVCVQGAGSALTMERSLEILSGSLTIRDQGTFSSKGVAIGSKGMGVAEALVDGPESTWTYEGELKVGKNLSPGILTIRDGATVQAINGRGIWIAQMPEFHGTILVDGMGSVLSDNALSLAHGGNGALLIRNGGLVAIDGDAWFSRRDGESHLAFGIGPDGSGLLDITGSLTIGSPSTLRITFDDMLVPDIGDAYTVIQAGGGINGTFTNEFLQTDIGPYRLTWDVQYNPNDVTLEILTVFIPEPTALGLMSLLLPLVLLFRSRWNN